MRSVLAGYQTVMVSGLAHPGKLVGIAKRVIVAKMDQKQLHQQQTLERGKKQACRQAIRNAYKPECQTEALLHIYDTALIFLLI